jgi:hypothetical protein
MVAGDASIGRIRVHSRKTAAPGAHAAGGNARRLGRSVECDYRIGPDVAVSNALAEV